MKIIDIHHKDIYAVAEISLLHMQYLVMFLEKTKVEYNSEEDPEMAKAVEYVTNELFPGLVKFIETIEREYGS